MFEELKDKGAYEKAVRAMESGDETAKTKIAFCKLSGLGGVKIDAEGAVALLEERAEKDDDEAKWILGLCCEFGIGIKQDIERAELLYSQSGEEGNVVGGFLSENSKDSFSLDEFEFDKGERDRRILDAHSLLKKSIWYGDIWHEDFYYYCPK